MSKKRRLVISLTVALAVVGLGFWMNRRPGEDALSRTWDSARDTRPPNPEMPIAFSTGPASVAVVDASGQVLGEFSGVVVGKLDDLQTDEVKLMWKGREGRMPRDKLRFADPNDQSDSKAWALVPRPYELSSLFGWSLRSEFFRDPQGVVVLQDVRDPFVLRASKYKLSRDTIEPLQYLTMSDKSLAFNGVGKWMSILSVAVASAIGVFIVFSLLARWRGST